MPCSFSEEQRILGISNAIQISFWKPEAKEVSFEVLGEQENVLLLPFLNCALQHVELILGIFRNVKETENCLRGCTNWVSENWKKLRIDESSSKMAILSILKVGTCYL